MTEAIELIVHPLTVRSVTRCVYVTSVCFCLQLVAPIDAAALCQQVMKSLLLIALLPVLVHHSSASLPLSDATATPDQLFTYQFDHKDFPGQLLTVRALSLSHPHLYATF